MHLSYIRTLSLLLLLPNTFIGTTRGTLCYIVYLQCPRRQGSEWQWHTICIWWHILYHIEEIQNSAVTRLNTPKLNTFSVSWPRLINALLLNFQDFIQAGIRNFGSGARFILFYNIKWTQDHEPYAANSIRHHLAKIRAVLVATHQRDHGRDLLPEDVVRKYNRELHRRGCLLTSSCQRSVWKKHP